MHIAEAVYAYRLASRLGLKTKGLWALQTFHVCHQHKLLLCQSDLTAWHWLSGIPHSIQPPCLKVTVASDVIVPIVPKQDRNLLSPSFFLEVDMLGGLPPETIE